MPRPAFTRSLLALALLAGAAVGDEAAPRRFTPATVPGAELRYVGAVPVAILTGTPAEIGRQHADLLAPQTQAISQLPHRYAAEFGVDAFWPLIVQAGRTLVLQAPQRHQDELRAMTDRAAAGEPEAVVANTLLELRRVGCSALVVEPSRAAGGGPLFGRNFDFLTLGELHKHSVLVVYRPAGLRAFASITFPGIVGVFSGMNDAGLAVATLDVEQAADGSRKFDPAGAPLAFVFRRILEECATVDEAERLLREVEPTTWMNLAVCDRDRGAVFEITPDTIARRDAEGGLVRCTNHFRTPSLSTGERCWRYDRFAQIDADGPPLDVHAVHAALDRVNQGEHTLQTMIFEPRELVLHLALGEPPVSDDPLTRIDLRPLLAAPATSP